MKKRNIEKLREKKFRNRVHNLTPEKYKIQNIDKKSVYQTKEIEFNCNVKSLLLFYLLHRYDD